MSDTDPKIPPSVIETRTPAQVEKLIDDNVATLETSAKGTLAHIKTLEKNFFMAVNSIGSSHELDQAKAKMAEARLWVVTHFTG